MGIIYGKLLFCQGISEESVDKKFSIIEYKNRMVFDWFDNPFTDDCGIPSYNPPPITIYDRPLPHKRSRYTPDLLPDVIYAASERYDSTLATPSDSPWLLLQTSGDPTPPHSMNKYDPYRGKVKIGYFYRKHDEKRFYKHTRLYFSTSYDKYKKLYHCHGFSVINSERMNCFM